MTYDNAPGGFRPAPSLDDHAGRTGPMDPPKPLKIALGIMVLSLLWQLIDTVITLLDPDTAREEAREMMESLDQPVTEAALDQAVTSSQVGSIVGALVSLLITVLAIWLLWRGHNWVRVLYTVLSVLMLVLAGAGAALLAAMSSSGAFSLSAWEWISLVVSLVLTAVTLWLLWHKDNSAHFARRRLG